MTKEQAMKGFAALTAAILGLIFALVFICSSPIFGGSFIVVMFSCAAFFYGCTRVVIGLRLKNIKKLMKESL